VETSPHTRLRHSPGRAPPGLGKPPQSATPASCKGTQLCLRPIRPCSGWATELRVGKFDGVKQSAECACDRLPRRVVVGRYMRGPGRDH